MCRGPGILGRLQPPTFFLCRNCTPRESGYLVQEPLGKWQPTFCSSMDKAVLDKRHIDEIPNGILW
jgi:hypothetical protein